MAIYGPTSFTGFVGLWNAGDKLAAKITLAEVVTVRSVWARGVQAHYGTGAYGFIYADAGGVPTTLLYATSPVRQATNGIIRCPFAAPVTLQPGTYWIGVHPFTSSSMVVGATTVEAADSYYYAPDDPPLDSPWVGGGFNGNRQAVWLDTESESFQSEIGSHPTTFSGLSTASWGGNNNGVYRIWVKKRQKFGAIFFANPASYAGKIRGVVYGNDVATGAPANLVAQSGEVVGPIPAASWVRLPFAAPITLDPGAYYIGFLIDATISIYHAYAFTAVDRATLASPYQGNGMWSSAGDLYADGPLPVFGALSEWGNGNPVMYIGEGAQAEDFAVYSVEPASGNIGAEVPVTITGFGFGQAGPTLVSFGGVQASNVVVVSGTQITCTAPVRISEGVVDVIVSDNTYAYTLVGGFTYVDPVRVDSVTPSFVHTAGSVVTVTGDGFDASVFGYVGSAPVEILSVSHTELSVKLPLHAAGAAVLTIEWPSGTKRTADITYEAAEITSVAPSQARPGDVVTITGKHLYPGALVVIGNDTSAATTWVSETGLTFIVPTLAPGVYDIQVLNESPSIGYSETLTKLSALEVLPPLAAVTNRKVVVYVVT